MTTSYSYSTYFVLNKAHFNECFANSVVDKVTLVDYRKAMGFVVVGMVLGMTTELNDYAAYFIVGLGIVEALSVHYRRPWWVARQLWSKAGNNKVTLTMDDDGLHTEAIHLKSSIAWQDISEIKTTQDGFLLSHQQGKSYISGSCLDDEAQAFLLSKIA